MSFGSIQAKEDDMQLMPLGDYYEWYCEWCDSRNLTLWTRVEEEKICCAVCYKSFEVGEQSGCRSGVEEPICRSAAL